MTKLAGYAATILKQIGQDTRMQIIDVLGLNSELCVNEIVGLTRQEQPNISAHLAKLVASGILSNRKEVPRSLYRVKFPEVVEIIKLAQSAAKALGAESAATLLKEMGQQERIKIILAIGEGELNATEITAAIDSKQSNTSRHLTALTDEKLLTARWQDGKKYFQVTASVLLIIIQKATELIAKETRQRQELLLSAA